LQTGSVALNYFIRRHPDLNWGINDLQSSALPLGYAALKMEDSFEFLKKFKRQALASLPYFCFAALKNLPLKKNTKGCYIF
jgi:hypothetical protein